MALFEDMERLKLHFLAAFQKLTDKGVLSEQQLEEIIQIVDKLDDLSVEEIQERLGRYIADVGVDIAAEENSEGGNDSASFA